MYFLTEDGKIAEGILLTDEQVQQRERLIGHFHDQVCRSAYHGTYDKDRKCESLANAFVTGEMAKIAVTPVAEKVEAE